MGKKEDPDYRQARHLSEKVRALIVGIFGGAAMAILLDTQIWEGVLIGFGVAGVGVLALDYLQKFDK